MRIWDNPITAKRETISLITILIWRSILPKITGSFWKPKIISFPLKRAAFIKFPKRDRSKRSPGRTNGWNLYEVDDDPKDAPWVEYEYTLFAGEKIRSVEKEQDLYRILFSDFTLTVIPYSNDEEVPRFYPAPYSKVLGTERLIKKCSCGGTGILDIDIVNDFGIRCDKCHKGTSANPCACDAIDEWNEIESLPIIGDYPKEEFERYRGKNICYIAVRKMYINQIGFPRSCDTIIMEIEDKKFEIGSCYCGHGLYDFTIEEVCDFNTEMWPYKIEAQSGKIRLIKEERMNGKKRMIFDIDREKLTVISEEDHLIIEKPDAVEVHSWDEK